MFGLLKSAASEMLKSSFDSDYKILLRLPAHVQKQIAAELGPEFADVARAMESLSDAELGAIYNMGANDANAARHHASQMGADARTDRAWMVAALREHFYNGLRCDDSSVCKHIVHQLFTWLEHNGAPTHSNLGASDDSSAIEKFAIAASAIMLSEFEERTEASHTASPALTYDEYSDITEELHNALRSLVVTEQELMRPQLGAVNFSIYPSQLSDLQDRCLAVRAAISPYVNQTVGNYAINAALTFADSLLHCIIDLRKICVRLDEKARGGKYGFFQYRRDIEEYKRKEAAREVSGSQLNSAFQRAW